MASLYTAPDRPRQTVPLRKQDVQLWRNGVAISHSAPREELLTADAITICLENQKNGHKGSILHHTVAPNPLFCPVRAGARRLDHLRADPPSTYLSTYHPIPGKSINVSAGAIRTAVRLAATQDDLLKAGYSPDRIGSHSLRASGAMALKLNGYDSTMIQKLGRWSSNTYLRYIQTQIGELTAGVAANMARPLTFHNVAAAA